MSRQTAHVGAAAPVQLHHRLDGRPDAPVLVLSDSLGTSLEMWDPQLSPLGARLRVLRYDHRGHGRSAVPRGPYTVAELAGDLLALLDRLGLERVSFCGLSLGAMVGMWLASYAPERIDRLVLCCTSAHLAAREAYLERAATVRKAGTAAVAQAVLERWVTPAFRASRPETVAWLERMLLATPAEGYAGGCEAVAGFDFRDRLRSIRAPTLVIAGAEDRATPPPHSEALAAAIPHARLTVLERAAHLANVERPAAVAEAVLAHVIEEKED